MIDAAFDEYLAASAAVDLLEVKLRSDPSYLDTVGRRKRAARSLRDNLEDTYLIRIFAVFEAGLRDVWENGWRRPTEPPMKDLIDAVAAKRLISQDVIDRAHHVRSWRNAVVHQGGLAPQPLTIEGAWNHLCKYSSRLPKDW